MGRREPTKAIGVTNSTLAAIGYLLSKQQGEGGAGESSDTIGALVDAVRDLIEQLQGETSRV